MEQTLCPSVLDTARMPLSLGGLGVGGVLMTRDAMYQRYALRGPIIFLNFKVCRNILIVVAAPLKISIR